MSAKEQLKKLEQNINIEYYIGKPAADQIRKACEPKKPAPKAEPKPKPKPSASTED